MIPAKRTHFSRLFNLGLTCLSEIQDLKYSLLININEFFQLFGDSSNSSRHVIYGYEPNIPLSYNQLEFSLIYSIVIRPCSFTTLLTPDRLMISFMYYVLAMISNLNPNQNESLIPHKLLLFRRWFWMDCNTIEQVVSIIIFIINRVNHAVLYFYCMFTRDQWVQK